MIDKLLGKVKHDMMLTKRDIERDKLFDDEFYRGVLAAYQIVLDMGEETKAEYVHNDNFIIDGDEDIYMAQKGVPKRDGSGGGTRKNAGRGGCRKPKSINIDWDYDFVKAMCDTFQYDYNKNVFDKE